jgi:hypothetical protein
MFIESIRPGWLAFVATAATLALHLSGCGDTKDEPGGQPEIGGGAAVGGAGVAAGGESVAAGGASFGGLAPVNGGGIPDIGQGGQLGPGPPRAWTWDEIDEAARSGPVPPDATLAPRDPAYTIPLSPSGEPGWRESTEPFCQSLRFSDGLYLWADDEGVAVATLGSCPMSDGDITPPPCFYQPVEDQLTGVDIQYNDGTGWRWVWGFEEPITSFSGLPGRDTLLISKGNAGVAQLALDGVLAPLAGVSGRIYDGVLGLERGAFLFNEGIESADRLLEVQSTTTLPVARVDSGSFIERYATLDGETIYYLAGASDFYSVGRDTPPVKLSSSPVGNYTALAADPAGGFWAANTEQIVHFDGRDWSVVGDVPGYSRVGRLVASGEEVYFVGSHHMGRASRSGVEILVENYGFWFHDIAASPSGELFVAVHDKSHENDQCSGDFIAHWDGAEFHLF